MAQVIGARLGLTTYTAGTDARPGRAEHNTERNQLESLVVIGAQGTEAARPTAGKARALYWNTERLTLQWDTGTSWQDISTNGGGGPGRAVLVAGTPTEGTSDRSARADHTHSLTLVTTTTHGAMSYQDKAKLDGATVTATASRMVIRDASGRAQVSTPSAGADIANKTYVDSVVGGAAAPVVTLDNNGLATPAILQATQRVDHADVANSAYSLMVRDADGRAQVSTPVAVMDATPKTYVDSVISSHRHDGSHITTGTINAARLPVVTTTAHGAMLNTDKQKLDNAASGANANSLVMRTPSGTFQSAEPTLTGDVTTKNYVDQSVGTRAATNHTHDGSAINTGTVSATRLPNASSSTAGIISSATYSHIYSHTHDASSISTGTIGTARLPYASGSSAGIIDATTYNRIGSLPAHNHDAASITAGTMSTARLPYAGSSSSGIITSSTYNSIWNHTHSASDITSGFLDYDLVWGSKHAYNTQWNGLSSNPARDVWVTAGGELCFNSSTIRHKTNVRAWEKDPRDLLDPVPSIYNRVNPETGEATDYEEVGVVAEQAGKKVPEFVEWGPDTTEDTNWRVQGWNYKQWTAAHQLLHRWHAQRDDHQDRELARILTHLGLEPLTSEED